MAKGNAMAIADLFRPDAGDLMDHYPNRREHAADFWVHMCALGLAVFGGGALFAFALMKGGIGLAAATGLYAFCLFAMLGCSALYNLSNPSPARRVLRRMDEAAIFVMIAGSCAPFIAQHSDGWTQWLFLGVIWTAAIAGAAGKILLPLGDRFWAGAYVAFGWLAALILAPLFPKMTPIVVWLLAAGGIVYTAGVSVYLWKAMPFRRAIWHGFVVSGAGLHFAAILVGVLLIKAM
jgi:hemolysin III